jgi:hypothetical protein
MDLFPKLVGGVRFLGKDPPLVLAAIWAVDRVLWNGVVGTLHSALLAGRHPMGGTIGLDKGITCLMGALLYCWYKSQGLTALVGGL